LPRWSWRLQFSLLPCSASPSWSSTSRGDDAILELGTLSWTRVGFALVRSQVTFGCAY
jgi:hypothetical protein